MDNGAPFNRCVACNDVITNPLCPDCLAERMAVSVKERDKELARAIKGCKIDGRTRCIKCGQKMGLCAHCFSMDIYQFLAGKNPAAAEEFLSRFDFDLRRELF